MQRAFACFTWLWFGCGHAQESPNPVPAIPAAPTIPAIPTAPTVRAVVVHYAARHATQHGASIETETKPARFVRVDVYERTRLEGTFTTDVTGTLRLPITLTPTHLVLFTSAAFEIGTSQKRVTVSRTATGAEPHTLEVPWVADMQTVNVDDERMTGAMHILDTLVFGYERMHQEVPSLELPDMFAHWNPDQTTDWSYYHGRSPSGIHWIELMAPRSDELGTADSDEHDAPIVLHEFGHFVFDIHSPGNSIGGGHPRGYRVDPAIAYEEGRATWLACMLLRDPHYIDAEGREPTGSARVDERIETPQNPRGSGSETSVAGVLWDLVDGDSDMADQDDDGITLRTSDVFAGMTRLARDDFHSLADLLRELPNAVDTVSAASLDGMLVQSGEPVAQLRTIWPNNVVTQTAGTIDGRSDPAPSGGRNRADSGYDANQAYRLLEGPDGRTSFDVILRIDGNGRAQSHTDLDMTVYSPNGAIVGESRGTTMIERVHLRADQLPVIVYVRDGGQGNRAGFNLTVE